MSREILQKLIELESQTNPIMLHALAIFRANGFGLEEYDFLNTFTEDEGLEISLHEDTFLCSLLTPSPECREIAERLTEKGYLSLIHKNEYLGCIPEDDKGEKKYDITNKTRQLFSHNYDREPNSWAKIGGRREELPISL